MAENPSHYSCPFLNQHVKVPDRIREKVGVDHAGEYEDVRHCIGLIAVNLLALGEVAYSRNSNFYTEHGARLYTRTSMKRAVDAAVKSGYAVRSREGYWNWEYGSGLSSTLATGPRLAEFGGPVELELDIGSLPLLAIDKRQVFVEEDLTAIQKREGVVEQVSLPLLPRLEGVYAESLRLNRDYWNKMELGTSNLGEGAVCMGQVGLTRVFKKGGVGRWFQRGGMSYQELSEDERARLLVNGEEVTELDYSAMHPHLLYAWKDKPCPDDFYERVMSVCGCSRNIAKRLTLMTVNAESFKLLNSGINFSKREGEGNLYDELKAHGLEPRTVVDAIIKAHPILEEYAFCGSAYKLMLDESDIMTAVLLQLMGQDIPALPIHDSVVFPKRHRETVKRVMEDEFLRRAKQPIRVS